MDALKSEVLAATVQRLTLYKISPPEELNSYVEEVEQSIQNYCNISQVPRELKFVWINILLDYFRWVAAQSAEEDSAPKKSSTPTILTSLREGDTNLGFSADTSSVEHQTNNAHKLDGILDEFVMNYTDSLNRFRRVVW